MPDLSWLFNRPTVVFLLGGLVVTLQVAAISIALSFILGSCLALARLAPLKWISIPATTYIEGMRALPLFLIIYFCYFALPGLLHTQIAPFTAGVIAMSAFTASMVAEIVRAGILSVPRGIVEAAKAQGLSAVDAMRLVILPIAIRRMMPALISQFVTLLKDTSLTRVIGILELLRRGQIVYGSPPFQPLPVLALVALMYFVVNFSIARAGRRLEART